MTKRINWLKNDDMKSFQSEICDDQVYLNLIKPFEWYLIASDMWVPVSLYFLSMQVEICFIIIYHNINLLYKTKQNKSHLQKMWI